ncbi:hypothetical protein ACFOGJ_14015 [Marinibaculum pumilum]|uniref:Uncharacterized protein n=1 Tax=Marinibaculum pumilum TaxID=1766165 RepID=A0ABV7L1Q0_9PROT
MTRWENVTACLSTIGDRPASPTGPWLTAVLALVAILFLAAPGAAAQSACAPTPDPSCAIYETCFAQRCPCEGHPDEYFRSYGSRYCSRFLENAGFTAAGRAWRDGTLRCLQERIALELEEDLSDGNCDCAGMRRFAFQTHVACYTQPGGSICALPPGDLSRIGQVIEAPEMLDPLGQAQMLEVARICTLTAPDDGRRAVWRGFRSMLSLP